MLEILIQHLSIAILFNLEKYEYIWYRGFTSNAMLDVYTEQLKIIFVGLEMMKVLLDYNDLARSSMKGNVDKNNDSVMQYRIKNCKRQHTSINYRFWELSIEKYMMKSFSKREQKVNEVVKTCISTAYQIQKAMECDFGM